MKRSREVLSFRVEWRDPISGKVGAVTVYAVSRAEAAHRFLTRIREGYITSTTEES